MKRAIAYFFSLLVYSTLCGQPGNPKIVRTYQVTSARQAVAVDSLYFYVINNSSITKHLKEDGTLVDSWNDEDSLLLHMNSGIIIEGKLYSINSNYPEAPMASSLEIFNPVTLEHIANHSFGILNGSATWLDFHGDHWYVAFAHYTGRGGEDGKNNEWTRLVKFDHQWRQIESWIFPPELVKQFGTRSNSGGVILADGRILCTGHDNYEIYVLRFPDKGYTLQWVDTIASGSYGQGIAYEKRGDVELIYGIIKRENKVVVTRIN
jgi:hypothetical protein